MDNLQNQPTTPTSAQNSASWGVVMGGIIAALLVAGGIYYVLAVQGTQAPSGDNSTAQGQDSLNSIEAELNAGGEVDNSDDLSNLEESL